MLLTGSGGRGQCSPDTLATVGDITRSVILSVPSITQQKIAIVLV